MAIRSGATSMQDDFTSAFVLLGLICLFKIQYVLLKHMKDIVKDIQ